MRDPKPDPSDAALPKPSKTQRKRDAAALQDLAAHLLEVKPALLAQIPLSNGLREAILAAHPLPQGGARKRQVQYIGKLLRQIDPAPLQTALETLQGYSLVTRQRQHQLQRLLHTLLAGDNDEITAFFRQYPQADRQHLHQLLRNACREKTQQPLPRTHRTLLRYLADITAKPLT